jgi:hypothetical protein
VLWLSKFSLIISLSLLKALNGETALHAAARNGKSEVLGMLLKYGADATKRNTADESPLDLAAQCVTKIQKKKKKKRKNKRRIFFVLLKEATDGLGWMDAGMAAPRQWSCC